MGSNWAYIPNWAQNIPYPTSPKYLAFDTYLTSAVGALSRPLSRYEITPHPNRQNYSFLKL